eukprot:783940_1
MARWIDDEKTYEKTDVLEMKINSFEDYKELENDNKFAPHMTYNEAKRLQIGDKIDYRDESGFCFKATIDEIEVKMHAERYVYNGK